MNIELAFAFAFVVFLTLSMVSWVVFGRCSMARIEKAILSEGKPRPCPWDGIGGRVIWYAYTVALPASWFNELDNRQLNTSDVKRYTTRSDQYRAWVLMVAAHGMVLLVFVAVIFDIG